MMLASATSAGAALRWVARVPRARQGKVCVCSSGTGEGRTSSPRLSRLGQDPARALDIRCSSSAL